MNDVKIILKTDPDFPPLLREMSDPPKLLHVRGNISPLLDKNMKILCVVGSRKYTNYGKEAVEKLVAGLKGYPVCIVSGLALGIDSIAHRSALEAELYTISFPGSGLDPKVLYPASHIRLSEEIVEKGGALLSEFDMDQEGTLWTFPQRNRLMAGISHVILVVEAGLVSGTLITSKFAGDYNRDVGAIPGNIFSPLSEGPHMLIRNGATPVTCVDDLLELLGFARRQGQSMLDLRNHPRFNSLSPQEKEILSFMQRGEVKKDILMHKIGTDARTLNAILSSLELEGFIKEENGVVRII